MRKFAFLSLLALLFGVIPAQPAAALTISISGTVTAAVGGAPIEGVAVALYGTSGTATTDATGHYSLSVDVPGPPMYQVVTFQATGYAFKYVMGGGSTVDAQLDVEAVFEGVVTSSAGGPVAGATVQASFLGCPAGLSQICPSTTTDSNGHYIIRGLPSGVLGGVTVSKTGFASQMSAGVTPVAGQTYTLDVVLQQKGSVTGVVTGPNGDPEAGVTVTAPGPDIMTPVQATTDSNGSYTLTDVGPGEVGVSFHKTGLADLSRTTTVPSGGQSTLDVQMELGSTLAITVLDENGNPASGVSVTVASDNGYGDPNGLIGPLSPTPGTSTVNVTGLPAGLYRVSASATGLASEWYHNQDSRASATPIPLSGGASGSITMRLDPGATITAPFTGVTQVWACAFAQGSNTVAGQCGSGMVGMGMNTTPSLTGLRSGSYKVLYYTGAKRVWFGGGSNRDSGAVVTLTKGESKTLDPVTDLSGVAGPLPAPAKPTLTKQGMSLLVESPDYQGYLATGFSYQAALRPAGGSDWTELPGSFSDKVLVPLPDGAFDLKVRAYSPGYQSEWSEVATYVPDAPGVAGKPSVVVAGKQVTVSWPVVSGAVEYQVRSRRDGGDWSESGWAAGVERVFADSPVGSWEFQVRGRNAGGDGGWSLTSDAAVVLPDAPDAPGKPLVTKSGDGYVLAWDAVASAGSYQVQRRIGGGSWTSQDAGTATSLTMTDLTPGRWEFQVRARNAGGDSGWSDATELLIDKPVTAPKSVKVGKKKRLPAGPKWKSNTAKTCKVTKKGKTYYVTGKKKGTCVLVSQSDSSEKHKVKIN